MSSRPTTFSKSPLQDLQRVVSQVSLFAARDVRKAIELLFVNCFWQTSLSPQSTPRLWKDHAQETHDPEGKLLVQACAKNLPNITEILLTKLSSSSSSPSVSLRTVADVDGQTPLMLAVHHNQLKLARRLLALGSNVNAQDTIITVGESALHRAACNGNREMCQLLLDNGAEVNLLDESGWNPMLAAIHHGQLEVLKLLLEKMLKEYRTQAIEQVKIQSIDEAASSPQVASNEFSPASRLPNGAASSAVFAHHFTEIRDVNGNNIFHCAAASGSVECIDFLSNVAITNSTRSSSASEVKSAAKGDDLGAFRERERYLATLMVEAAHATKRTPLHGAVESGSEAAVQAVLKRCGVLAVETIDAQDISGDTALIKAARRGYDKLVSLLLKSAANQQIRNGDGESALDVAGVRRNDNCVALLSDRRNGGGCCC